MRLRSTLYMLGFLVAGCTPGSVGSGDDTGDDDGDLPSNALCEATLTVTGTLAPPGVPPAAEEGCVPEGTWTLNVAVDSAGTCGDVSVADTYAYTVIGEGRERTIDYTTAAGEEVTLGIHAGGNGECEGSFEHIWATTDGSGEFHVVLLKPWFDPGTLTIQGGGTYQLWSQRP